MYVLYFCYYKVITKKIYCKSNNLSNYQIGGEYAASGARLPDGGPVRRHKYHTHVSPVGGLTPVTGCVCIHFG